jgi:hypothetical protein
MCAQVLLTHDGNFRLRAKGYGIEVAKFGAGDSASQLPGSRQELLERFFPDVIPSPEQVCARLFWPALSQRCMDISQAASFPLQASQKTVKMGCMVEVEFLHVAQCELWGDAARSWLHGPLAIQAAALVMTHAA